MKQTLTLLMAAMLLMPLTLAAQHDSDYEHSGRDGKGFGGMEHMDESSAGMHDGGGRHQTGMGHLLAMGDEIGLTDDQRVEIKQLMVAHRLEQIDRRAEVQKAKVRLRVLMHDDEAAESDVTGQIDRLSDLRADLQKSNYTHRKNIHAILTAEQLEKMKEMKSAKGKHRGKFGKARRKFGQAREHFGRQQRSDRGGACCGH